MRFAYIDSQGKEVGIPSLEALQLRIELGAIGETTMFFDASADKWAAAGEHEIFRTLTRELRAREEGTFVAPPPPPAPGLSTPPVTDEPPAAEETPPAAAPEVRKARAPNPFDREEDPEDGTEEQVSAPDEAVEEDEVPDFDLGGMDLEADAGGGADAPAESPGPAAAGESSDMDFSSFGTFDLVEEPDEPEVPAPAASPDPFAAPPSGDEPPSTFDMGEFGALEVEGDDAEDDTEETGSFSGLELEQSFAEQHEGPSNVRGGGMEMEAPLSDYSPDEAPSWMMEDEDEEEEEPAGAASGTTRGGEDPERGSRSGDGEGREGDIRRRPGPAGGPAAPEAEELGGLFAVLGVLVILVGGAWFGWNALGDGGGEDAVVEEPPVVIPPIDPGLEPVMTDLAGRAYEGFLDSARAMAAAADLPPEPNPDWLSGSYLGNASEYDDVEAYWNGVERLVTDLRASEEAIFVDELEPLLAESELEEGARRQVRERAVAGFQAAARDRRPVYEQLHALTSAALGLHEFLVGNEDQIEYTPAAGGLSRDPVVEAVPSSPQIGAEMWDRVGRIPDALDALGALDKVSTQRLLDLLVQTLEATPIR